MGKHESRAIIEAELKRLCRRRPPWSTDDARYVLTAWVRSGLRLEGFARRYGLVPQRLRWWRKQLGHWDGRSTAAQTTALVPAVIVEAPRTAVVAPVVEANGGAGHAAVVVRVPGSVAVEVATPTQVSPHWLAAFVAALGARA